MLGLPSNSRKSHDRVHMSSLSSPTALNSGTRCKLEDAASSKTARKQESPQCHREPRAATHRAGTAAPRDCCATHDACAFISRTSRCWYIFRGEGRPYTHHIQHLPRTKATSYTYTHLGLVPAVCQVFSLSVL